MALGLLGKDLNGAWGSLLCCLALRVGCGFGLRLAGVGRVQQQALAVIDGSRLILRLARGSRRDFGVTGGAGGQVQLGVLRLRQGCLASSHGVGLRFGRLSWAAGGFVRGLTIGSPGNVGLCVLSSLRTASGWLRQYISRRRGGSGRLLLGDWR